MNSVNNSFTSTVNSWKILSLDTKLHEIKDAYILGLDFAFFHASKDIELGIRVAYLGAEQGLAEINTPTNYIYKAIVGANGGIKEKVDAKLIPIMFGGSYSKKLSKGFAFKAKGFAGIAFASAKGSSTVTGNINNPDIIEAIESSMPAISSILPPVNLLSLDYKRYNIDQHGDCLIADLSLGIECELSENWGLGIDVGYRYTPEVKLGDLNFDFSGFKVVAGVVYKI